MRLNVILGVFVIFWSCFTFATETNAAETDSKLTEEQKYLAWANELWNSLERKTGKVALKQANAVLNVPENFYYLNAKDSATVLTDIWGNPPGQTTLGMLFPSNMTPFDEGSWAVTIQYEEDGYVSDTDADDINYGELLEQMKDSTLEASKARVEQGYETIELVGWASSPYYDSQNKKLHWAKEIKFGSQSNHTLNYNIRVLGRKGVVVLNFIASMEQKEIIDSQIDAVLAMAEFEKGSQYSDFNPDIDEVAAYGLGALVAGKVIAKTGFLALALVFLKKFWIFILLGLGAVFKAVFSKKNDANTTSKESSQ